MLQLGRRGLPAVLLAASVSLGLQAAEHPSLVSVAATECATCHDDLLARGGSAHLPAVEDCTGCHEVAIADSGTDVTLMEQEPVLCLICHDDKTSAVEGDLPTPHYPVSESCLTCHDPHSSGTPHLLTAPVPDLCAACHEIADLAESHGGQITAATDCGSCHQPHGSETAGLLRYANLHAPFAEKSCDGCHRAPFGGRIRLIARREKLCEACHGDVAESAADGGSVHQALEGERGRAGCVSCHDAHMSNHEALLRTNGPELCGRCHAEIVTAAQGENGHASAAEDCLICHQPHASGERRLLAAHGDELCGSCHEPEDPDLIRSHLGADVALLACTQCHDPHGGAHPKLLAQHLHAPLLDGCDTCHEGAFDSLQEDGGSSLCLICHDDIGETAQTAETPHAALDVAPCTDCHNPHASAQPSLVKLPRGEICSGCHEDQSPGPEQTGHGVIDLIGCEACHEPHGGDRAQLLRDDGDQLCLACHTLHLSADGRRGHPVANHPVQRAPIEAGTKRKKAPASVYEEEIGCLTCHDPHKGRSNLLRWDAGSTSDACVHCHTK